MAVALVMANGKTNVATILPPANHIIYKYLFTWVDFIKRMEKRMTEWMYKWMKVVEKQRIFSYIVCNLGKFIYISLVIMIQDDGWQIGFAPHVYSGTMKCERISRMYKYKRIPPINSLFFLWFDKRKETYSSISCVLPRMIVHESIILFIFY